MFSALHILLIITHILQGQAQEGLVIISRSQSWQITEKYIWPGFMPIKSTFRRPGGIVSYIIKHISIAQDLNLIQILLAPKTENCSFLFSAQQFPHINVGSRPRKKKSQSSISVQKCYDSREKNFWGGHDMQQEGSQFPDQGQNPCHLQWKREVFNYWTAKQVPTDFNIRF